MKHSMPLKNSGFAKSHNFLNRDARLAARAARMANLAEIHRAAPPVARGVIERVIGAAPAQPKEPADRNQAVRDLAMGEHCQVRYAPICRHPAVEYTVWAHPNTLAEQKGMGYKANDSGGVFACDRCHEAIDRDRKLLPTIELEEVWRGARERTLIRARFIAASPTERPWRVRAARWLIEKADGSRV